MLFFFFRGTENKESPSHLGWGVQQPLQSLALSITHHPSSSQRLNIPQHFIKSLPGRRFGVLKGDLDPAVETEGLQLQPDESKAIVVEENKNTRGSLGAGEAVASNKPRPIKAAGREEQQRRVDNSHEYLILNKNSNK